MTHDNGSAVWGSGVAVTRASGTACVTGFFGRYSYRILAGQGALRCWGRLANHGHEPVTVEWVTSFLCGGLCGGTGSQAPVDLRDLDVRWAENDWLAEGRWQRRPLRDALPDLNRRVQGADPRGRFGLTSLGSWSAGTYLPMGAVAAERAGHAWVWQIEHNGGWHWQVRECTQRRAAGSGAAGTRPKGPSPARTSRCSARPTPSISGGSC